MNKCLAPCARRLTRLVCLIALSYVSIAAYPNCGIPAAQLPGTSRGQTHPATYYAESWKTGDNRRIEECVLRLRLDRFTPNYETVLTDVSRTTQYRLTVEPSYFLWDDSFRMKIANRPKDGVDSPVNLWQVGLYEPDEKVSLLVANRDQGHVIDEDNTLTSLAPIEESNWLKTGIFGVPILSSRVIRVQGVYCVINVKGYELRPAKDRAFEWVDLQIEFTNTRPDVEAQKARRNP